MKLKVQHVMDSMLVLTNIINRQCPMPQRGKYLIARMHAKLLPEFKTIDARRDAMIKAYGNPQTKTVTNPETGVEYQTPVEGQWQVPPEMMGEFTAAWEEIGEEEIDVDISPLPLTALCMPNGTEGLIESGEFITLGELVYDNAA